MNIPETWTMDMLKCNNVASFPATGDAHILYIDVSSATDQTGLTDADLYEWDGTQYNSFIGRRPKRPPAS